jgi:hypothetical protein
MAVSDFDPPSKDHYQTFGLCERIALPAMQLVIGQQFSAEDIAFLQKFGNYHATVYQTHEPASIYCLKSTSACGSDVMLHRFDRM